MFKLFGDNLKKLRTNFNLTQQQLAAKLKVSPSTIGMYESNRRMPDTILLCEIANFFDVSIDYLLGRENNNSTKSFSSTQQTQEVANNSKILQAVKKDEELLEFTKELAARESMQLLFKQVKPLSDDEIARVLRIIKAIEDEEDRQDMI